MKLPAIGLALAVLGVVAASAPAWAQYGRVPAGGPMPPGSTMMMPPGGAMMPPGGMPPGGPMPPAGMMSPADGAMMGSYPGLQPVMPYPGGPMDGCGCGAPYGCGASCGGDACGCECGCDEGCGGCLDFGRGGGCGCECCCEPDGTPHWRARLDAVMLTFDLPDAPAVLSTDAAGTPLLGIGSLEFDREFSGRLSIEARLPNNDGIELAFLGFLRWNDSASVLDPGGGLSSPYQSLNGGNVDPYDNALEHDISYSSRFLSFEANWWKPVFCADRLQSSVMLGFRFIRVAEDFGYNAFNADDGGTSGTTNVHTSNNIPALQLGMMCSASLTRNVSLRCDGKFGVGCNFASQSTDIVVTSAGGANNLNYSENIGSQKGAFQGEAAAVLTWQLNCYVALHAGYQVLWLDDLALAPENFNATFPTAGFRPVLIQDNANRFYHGALAGVDITW